jgi:hypothetical protein
MPFAVQVIETTEKYRSFIGSLLSLINEGFAGLSLGVSMLLTAAVLNWYTSWLLVQMSRATGAESYEVCPLSVIPLLSSE